MSETGENSAGCYAAICSQEPTIQAALTRIAQLEKTAAIGQLAYGIVHDFNNILGATRSFADLIAQSAVPGTAQHEYAARIMAICNRAMEMVGQINTIADIRNAGRERVPIDAILDEVSALLHGLLPTGVALSVSNNTSNRVIAASASQLVRVLLNIAVNAGESLAGRDGQVSILAADVREIERELPRTSTEADGEVESVTFATGVLRRSISYVKFSIADTGSGISQRLAAKIFEPFFTTKGKHRGAGLGLAIVKDIVAAHDGIIAMHSRIGEGTVFHVYLPATEARARHAKVVTSGQIMTCPHGVDGCMNQSPVADDKITYAEQFPRARQNT